LSILPSINGITTSISSAYYAPKFISAERRVNLVTRDLAWLQSQNEHGEEPDEDNDDDTPNATLGAYHRIPTPEGLILTCDASEDLLKELEQRREEARQEEASKKQAKREAHLAERELTQLFVQLGYTHGTLASTMVTHAQMDLFASVNASATWPVSYVRSTTRQRKVNIIRSMIDHQTVHGLVDNLVRCPPAAVDGGTAPALGQNQNVTVGAAQQL
jgi:hypothetical protein